MCSPLCESNFISIYQKFDEFGDNLIQTLNTTSVEVSHDLKQLVDEMSLALLIKTKLSIQKISHQHARLDANSRVLEQLLEPVPELVLHTTAGMNWFEFLGLCFVVLCIGFNIEMFRKRNEMRDLYEEIL